MNMSERLVIDLPPTLLNALQQQARTCGQSPAKLAQWLLERGLSCSASSTATAKTPLARADEGAEDHLRRLVTPLRARLAADLFAARDWDDLQKRLAHHGYTFRERGGGLALFCTKTAAHICKATDLGWTYSKLMRRFDAPFPGHSHFRLAERVLNRTMPERTRKRANPSLFPDLDDEDLILFEDE